jgi:hypothetical protein
MTKHNKSSSESNWTNVNRKGAIACRTCGSTSNFCSYVENDPTVWICRAYGGPNSVQRRGALGPYWLHFDGDRERGLERHRGRFKTLDAIESAPAGSDLADAETLDAVYRALLQSVGLAYVHRQQLVTDRAFDPDDLIWEKTTFATYPHRDDHEQLCNALQEKFGLETLARVPGFRATASRAFLAHENLAALMIPVRSADAKIVGVQLRLDEPMPNGGRYLPFACPRGTEGSVTHPTPLLHVPNVSVTDRSKTFVVEGIFKAEDLARKLGLSVIAVPSAGAAWRALEQLQAWGTTEVVLALDADCRTKAGVADPLRHAAATFAAAGLEVIILSWLPSEGKGPDDLRRNGRWGTTQEVRGAALWSWLEDVCRSAGAEPDLAVAGRAVIATALDGLATDPDRAFTPEVLQAVARLDEGSVEFRRVVEQFKAGLTGKYTEWRKAVVKAGKVVAVTDRAAKAKARGDVVFNNGDHVELALGVVSHYMTNWERYDPDKKARVIERIRPIFTEGLLYRYDDTRGIWAEVDHDQVYRLVSSWRGTIVTSTGKALFLTDPMIEGVIRAVYKILSKGSKGFFTTEGGGCVLRPLRPGFDQGRGSGEEPLASQPRALRLPLPIRSRWTRALGAASGLEVVFRRGAGNRGEDPGDR